MHIKILQCASRWHRKPTLCPWKALCRSASQLKEREAAHSLFKQCNRRQPRRLSRMGKRMGLGQSMNIISPPPESGHLPSLSFGYSSHLSVGNSLVGPPFQLCSIVSPANRAQPCGSAGGLPPMTAIRTVERACTLAYMRDFRFRRSLPLLSRAGWF